MKVVFQVLLAGALAVNSLAETAEWIASTAPKPWVAQPGVNLSLNRDDAPYDSEVRLDKPSQKIDGWGGCFNELGWVALQALPDSRRSEVLQNLFAPGGGLNFTICRMPIGASDYATNWYSLDETTGDFALKNFNLDRDRLLLLPYLKAAMKYQPKLKIWGSPWSPPSWMKVNQSYHLPGTNRMIQTPPYLAAHARYLAKYVQAYRTEGVKVFAVAVQNEPFASQVFPSCVWSPTELRDFIRDYVGPTFDREHLAAEIWLGTMNNNQPSAFDTVLSDPGAAKYVSAVGFQWAGKNALATIHERYPHLKKVQTESECGDGSFNWNAAEHTFSLMKHYFRHGISLYTYWNMVLDDSGRSTWGWKQNALIRVNRTNSTVTYTPEYYLFQHVSHFVPADSVVLPCDGPYDDGLAFSTPSGKIVLVLANPQSNVHSVSVKVGTRNLSVTLRPKSFNTFVFSRSAVLTSGTE